MKYMFKITSLAVVAASLFAPAARASDVPTNDSVRVLGTVKVNASAGDSISAARRHHHDYIYVAHNSTGAIDVIDVSDPASPRQLTGSGLKRARPGAKTAVINVAGMAAAARIVDLSDLSEPHVLAEFPDAISATSDRRKLIYILGPDSLQILTTKPQSDQSEQPDSSVQGVEYGG